MPACPACGSLSVSLFGHQSGKQRYRCRLCQKTWRDNPKPHGADPRRKALILAAYHERMSLRGLARTFGVSRSTVSLWLKDDNQKSEPCCAPEPDTGTSADG